MPSLTVGGILGTPMYISPEQAMGGKLDGRSDIYATGVMLYEMLCGRLPFESETPTGYLTKHMIEEPPPLEEKAPDLHFPEEVKSMVMRCLRKKPGERFQTAEDFVAAIDGFLEGEVGKKAGQKAERRRAREEDIPELSGNLEEKKIGNYLVSKLLGEGGFGTVYRAEHLFMKRPAALKVLHRDLVRDETFLKRFVREAQVIAGLKHPSIVEIYDFGEVGGVYYIAMEYVEGRSLEDMIEAEGPLSPDRAIFIMRQVLSALGKAHESGIVHRDLKPDNIMVLEEDQAKVLDFGIAKIMEFEGSPMTMLTRQGAFFGTPAYASPEQAGGKPLDSRSDLYSLGVVLYEMLCGMLPFHSESPQGFLAQHITEEPPPIRVAAPDLDVPEELDRAVLKALRKDPDERYRSAREFAEALMACSPRGVEIEVSVGPAESEREEAKCHACGRDVKKAGRLCLHCRRQYCRDHYIEEEGNCRACSQHVERLDRAKLHVKGRRRKTIFLIAKERIEFGRNRRDLEKGWTNDITTRIYPFRSDANYQLSGTHGVFTFKEDGAYIVDLSTKGIVLDGMSLERGGPQRLPEAFTLDLAGALRLDGRLFMREGSGEDSAAGGEIIGLQGTSPVDAILLRRPDNFERHEYLLLARQALIGRSDEAAVYLEGPEVAEDHARLLLSQGRMQIERGPGNERSVAIDGISIPEMRALSLPQGARISVGGVSAVFDRIEDEDFMSI
jgi:serine/threonine protein kinase